MNFTQIGAGSFPGVEYYLPASALPVDEFTRRLVRDVVCRVGPEDAWAIIRSRRFCKSLLYWCIKRYPVALEYEIYTGGEWTKHAVIPAVG